MTFFSRFPGNARLWFTRSLYMILLFGATACETYRMKVVADFDAPVKLEAEDTSSQAEIVRLKLRIKSNTAEPVQMGLRSHDQLIREIHLQAGDKITILADCYSNQAEITFIGDAPKNGSIEIEYKFVEL